MDAMAKNGQLDCGSGDGNLVHRRLDKYENKEQEKKRKQREVAVAQKGAAETCAEKRLAVES